MPAVAGEQESDSLSLFVEVHDMEVQKELSTMATLSWAEGRVDGQVEEGAAEGVEEADLCCTEMEKGEKTRRSRHV